MKTKRQIQQEPIWDPSKPEGFLGCVSWYRAAATDYAKYKAWTLEYLKKSNANSDKIALCPPNMFASVGIYCRIATRSGAELPDFDGWKQTAQRILHSLEVHGASIEKAKNVVVETPKKKAPTTSIAGRIENQVSDLFGVVSEEIDKFVAGSCKSTFSITNFLKSYKVKSQQSSMIADLVEPIRAEIEEALAGTCEQLDEAYDFLTKPQKNRFLAFLAEIVDTCRGHSKVTKSMRKPRKKKQRPPGEIIKKLQFLAKCPETGVSSIDPRKVVDATKLVVFNTKTNTIAIYESSEHTNGLSVKGTTLIGFDEKKSKQKRVRNTKEIAKLSGAGVRALNNYYASLKTKENVPTGRINKYCLLVQAYK